MFICNGDTDGKLEGALDGCILGDRLVPIATTQL
jgi:hypothetical protein